MLLQVGYSNSRGSKLSCLILYVLYSLVYTTGTNGSDPVLNVTVTGVWTLTYLCVPTSSRNYMEKGTCTLMEWMCYGFAIYFGCIDIGFGCLRGTKTIYIGWMFLVGFVGCLCL